MEVNVKNINNLIRKVYKNSIADEIGIEVGDILLSINGERVEDIIQYKFLISDEYIEFVSENGFTGFRNDSITGTNRLKLGFESVVFSPRSWMGFRSAYFAFGDVGYLFEPGEELYNGKILSSVGLGIRVRNDNLVLNTISIRFSYYPTIPKNSNYKNIILSGEQLLRPANFDPTPPTVIPYYSRQR